MIFLHGAAGAWDELGVVLVAFAVLWLAVRLAGRSVDEADEEAAPEVAPGEEARPLGPQ